MFYMFTLILFFFTLTPLLSDNVSMLSDLGNITRNAPYVIFERMIFSTIIGSLFTVIIIASSVVRDYEDGIAELVFTTSIRKEAYIFGRFLGATTASLIMFVGPALAILLVGILRSNLVGDVVPQAYLSVFLIFVLPNILFIGGLTFMMATLAKKMLNAYIGLFGFFMFYLLANVLTNTMVVDQTYELIAFLSDSFGMAAFIDATNNWSVQEKSTLLVPVGQSILLNRVLWLGCGLLSLLTTYYFFSFETKAAKPKRNERKNQAFTSVVSFSGSKLKLSKPVFDKWLPYAQFWMIAKSEIRNALKNRAFWIICIIFLANFLNTLFFVLDQQLGIPVYPYTSLIVNAWDSNVFLGAFVLITVFSGEIIWKERQSKLDTILDSLPFHDTLMFLGKTSALIILIAIYLFLVGIVSVAFQLINGFYDLEIGLMLQTLLVKHFFIYMLWLAMALFLHNIAVNKYMGFFLMFLFFAWNMYATFNTDNYLFSYATLLSAYYTDMAGYDVYLKNFLLHEMYWASLAGFLSLVAILIWRRGVKLSLKERIYLVGRRLNYKYGLSFLLIAIFIVSSGSVLYKKAFTEGKNIAKSERDWRKVQYEKKYKGQAGEQPRITNVDLRVDFYPSIRQLDISGAYQLKNRSQQAIDSVHVTCKGPEVVRISIGNAALAYKDTVLGYYIFALNNPLLPNDSVQLQFSTSTIKHLVNYGRQNTNMVENGMMFNNIFTNSAVYTPRIGYEVHFELNDELKRQQYNLPAKNLSELVSSYNDPNINLTGGDAEWINFNAIVSTESDQQIAGTGKLERTWEEKDRRFFHFRSELPMNNIYMFISAQYAVKKVNWKDVEISIYYHPEHNKNIDYILDFVQKSLVFSSQTYGKYPYSQMRVAEFPGYFLQGQSYPNLLTISGEFGFKYDLRNTDYSKLEMLSWVAVHEVVHQWWINQLIPARVPGSILLTEAICEYSTLQVIKETFGEEYARTVLKIRRSEYFRRRGLAKHPELALAKTLDQIALDQSYIGYYKTSLVMNALSEHLGADTLESILRSFFTTHKFDARPYPMPDSLIEQISRHLPDSLQYLKDDLFYNITVFDNKIKQARTKPINGQFELTVTIECNKVYVDSNGQNQPAPLNDYLDIGIYDDQDRLIKMETFYLTKAENKLTFYLDTKPERVELDPKVLLMDKSQDDNTMSIK